MHIHILGICGTFMGGIAVLARQAGHKVSGCDLNVYPPMSTQLEQQGIQLIQGYDVSQLDLQPDLVVIGNVMSRGNPLVEAVLNRGLRYTSGPQWLSEQILQQRWVLAAAGTHGKTTTSSMLAWILEYAGLSPGYLIGGVPGNFDVSARLGDAPFFVIEADEYDTAFFDKRSKFVHYRPRTLINNNLEYDHADIFDDLEAIQRQFHHLVRTVPGEGLIINHAESPALDAVMQSGCWTPVESFAAGPVQTATWQAREVSADGSCFDVVCHDQSQGRLEWPLIGVHNVNNALAAIAAARHAGVPPAVAIEALQKFKGVRRRMELRADINGIRLYDDFAHHPTAIASTLAGLRAHVGEERIWVLLEPRSNTMRMGVHKDLLADALHQADRVCIYQAADLGWDAADTLAALKGRVQVYNDVDQIVADLRARVQSGDHVLIMSNGGFNGIHEKLSNMLKQLEAQVQMGETS